MNKLYRRQELSAETGLSPRNIQFYTENGILNCVNPEDIGTGKFRFYTDEELKKAKLLNILHKLGIKVRVAKDIVGVFESLGYPKEFRYGTGGATISLTVKA
jgi:DNA-binding transcriptional MerR regulator